MLMKKALGTHRLVDCGACAFDKVKVRNRCPADWDCSDVYTILLFRSKTYEAEGVELIERE
jgi:hypothetical protein